MKKISVIIFSSGLVIFIYFFQGSLYMLLGGDGLNAAFGSMLIGLPLIIIGLVLYIINMFITRRK